MSDPLACRECAAHYRQNRASWLADAQTNENLRAITAESYEFVADILEVESPVMAYRARQAARQKFDRGAWINSKISAYHNNGHVAPACQPETVDDPPLT